MAVRPDQLTSEDGTIVYYSIAASQTVASGQPVKYASADHQVQQSQSSDPIHGIALDSGTSPASGTLAQIPVQLLGHAVVPVVVGTGGATRGKFCIMASDNTGLTDQTMGGGTTVRNTPGYFTQSGVVGDVVGLCVTGFAGVSS